MLDGVEKRRTEGFQINDKMSLFKENHPVIRELHQIGEIIFPGDETGIEESQEYISLKELFQKKNMDLYHVDCLMLLKIARNVLRVQEELGRRNIFPGLCCLEDIYINTSDSSYSVVVTHPEKFQLLKLEQDYEWYPEDERILGDVCLFDQESQEKADQRLLYKILVASAKGNVKVPPKANAQDYSSLFFGTLPASWQEVFEKDQFLSHGQWRENLDGMIASEEYYETKTQGQPTTELESDAVEMETGNVPVVKSLFVILRTECRNSLDISKLLYEMHDQLELDQSHGKFQSQQAYLFGDKVLYKKDFAAYGMGYRIQIPQAITEYSIVETLLVGCEWMWEIIHTQIEENKKIRYRMYILSDGKIENNIMFKECQSRLETLKNEGCEIHLEIGKKAHCEGWSNLKEHLELN